MKKISTLFMGLIIALSAVAAPVQLLKKQVAKQGVSIDLVKDVQVVKQDLRAPLRLAAPKVAAKAPQAKADALASGTFYTTSGKFLVYYQESWMDATSYMPSIEVAIDGDSVSITGLAFYFQEGAISGTISGNTLTFPSGQLVGTDAYGDEYLVGSNDGQTISDIVFVYDQDAQTLTAKTAYIFESESATAINPYGYWYNAVFSAVKAEAPAGGDFVADAVRSIVDQDAAGNDLIQYVLVDTEDLLRFYFTFPLAEGQSDVVSGQTYSLDDMMEQYSFILFNGTDYILMDSASFTKTVNDDESYTIVASAVDTLGQVWNVSFAQAAPALDTLELTGMLDFYDASMTGELGNVALIQAFNEDTSRYAGLILLGATTFTIQGDFTASDLYNSVVVLNDSVEYVINGASIHVEYDDEESVYHITGTLYTYNYEDASDIVKFTLNLTITGAAPEQFEPSDMTFQFQVTEESVIVIPSNEDDPWAYTFIDQVSLDSFCSGSIDTLAAMMYAYYGDTYAAAGEYEIYFTELQDQGIEGEVILVVWGSHGGVTTAADSVSFIVPEKEVIPSDMTFTLTNTGSAILVTPSIDDKWDYALFTKAQFESYANVDSAAAAAYAYYGDTYATTGEHEVANFASILASAQMGAGEYVIVVYGCDGGVTTPAAYLYFGVYAEGIEDIKAAGKAVKVLRNGQLNIEKGNKVFNVFGAQLK